MKFKHHIEKIKRVPLWKWIIIIALVIAMPLFFNTVRYWQTQQAMEYRP